MANILKLALEMMAVGTILIAVSLGKQALLKGWSSVVNTKHLWPMITGLMQTGAVSHLLLEATGVNAWYAKNYRPLL